MKRKVSVDSFMANKPMAVHVIRHSQSVLPAHHRAPAEGQQVNGRGQNEIERGRWELRCRHGWGRAQPLGASGRIEGSRDGCEIGGSRRRYREREKERKRERREREFASSAVMRNTMDTYGHRKTQTHTRR